ncbi:MAG: glycosyltransferase [Marinicaulis sp.]|nr:glycosyltransferase [Marinicaulis sp.]
MGGASNFFGTEPLAEIGGWDPFNVTEDADLGIRLSKLGFRVGSLDSTTFEKANCDRKNWIRRCSRWMKGYMQTWLVHMREPGIIIENSGYMGFLSVQLFTLGNGVSALLFPVLSSVLALGVATQSTMISAVYECVCHGCGQSIFYIAGDYCAAET